jgi:uncharacterized metal-binding protein YceD (DUF177 family)
MAIGNELKISTDDLRALPQQRLMLQFHEKLDGISAVKPVLGELSLTYSASSIRLVGRVKTLLKLECDTCLRPYFQALTVDIEEKFVSDSFLMDDRETKERELQRGDFVEPIPDNGVLDITDVVYQAVTLATPAYCNCGDECPGPPQAASPPREGAEVEAGATGARAVDQPIDPRWKNLKTLFPNEDSQQNS